MLSPVVISMAVFTLVVGLKFSVVSAWGAAGLVAATSLYYLLNACVLAAILLWRLSPDMLAGSGRQLARSLFSSLVACFVAAGVIRLPIPLATLQAAFCGIAVYLMCTWLLRDEFALKLSSTTIKTLRR